MKKLIFVFLLLLCIPLVPATFFSPNRNIQMWDLFNIFNLTNSSANLYCDNAATPNCGTVSQFLAAGGQGGGTINGSGTPNTVAKFASPKNITDSGITDDGVLITNTLGTKFNSFLNVTGVLNILNTISLAGIIIDQWQDIGNLTDFKINESQIRDLSPHTNRSDADILSVASVYNDTLRIDALNNSLKNETAHRINNDTFLSGRIDGVNSSLQTEIAHRINNDTANLAIAQNNIDTNSTADRAYTDTRVDSINNHTKTGNETERVDLIINNYIPNNITNVITNGTLQLNITAQTCSDTDKFSSFDGITFTCTSDDVGGGGGGDKWVDNGVFISPNTTFASEVNATKFTADMKINITKGGIRSTSGVSINASDFYDDGVLLITSVVDKSTNDSQTIYTDAQDVIFNDSMTQHVTDEVANIKVGAWKLGNFSDAYGSRNPYGISNFTTDYNAIDSRFDNSNYTGLGPYQSSNFSTDYTAQTGRFGVNNWTTLYFAETGRFDNTNYTGLGPYLFTNFTNDYYGITSRFDNTNYTNLGPYLFSNFTSDLAASGPYTQTNFSEDRNTFNLISNGSNAQLGILNITTNITISNGSNSASKNGIWHNGSGICIGSC